MSDRICPECGAPVASKPAGQPGPQPIYCGRACQLRVTHRAHRQRAADYPAALARIAQLEHELAEARALLDLVDWARVPAAAVEVPFVDRHVASSLVLAERRAS